MTSHAAVVARGMGKCCVAGCGDVVINEQRRFTVGDIVVNRELHNSERHHRRSDPGRGRLDSAGAQRRFW